MLSFSSGKLNNMITTDVDKARRATWILERLMFFFFQFCSLYRIHNFKLWQWVYLLLWFKKNLNTMDSFQLCFASHLRIHQLLCTLEALRQIHVLLLTVPLLCSTKFVQKILQIATSHRQAEAPLQVAISIVALHSLMGASVFIGLSWMGFVTRFKPHVSHGKLCSVSKFTLFWIWFW